MYAAIMLAVISSVGLGLIERTYFDEAKTVASEHTYTGLVGQILTGIYHTYWDHGEWVFYLATSDGRMIRLIFYCGNPFLSSPGEGNFCVEPTQIPIVDGHETTLKGTLLYPSDWKPELSEIRMQFDGDLYVLEMLAS